MNVHADFNTTTNLTQGQRYDHFQVIRGIACLMVFLGHIIGLLSNSLTTNGAWYEPLIVPVGFPWVWLFLILSGFLLTKQFVTGRSKLDGPGIRKFYGRRSRRLFPMLIFSPILFGSCYLLGIWSPELPAFRTLNEAMIAFAMPWTPYVAYNPIASVNSPVWSAVIEVHYFLALPVLLLATQLQLKPILVLLGIWAMGILWILISTLNTERLHIFPMIYQQHFYNAGFMLAGCALAIFAEKSAPKKTSWLWPIAATTVTLIGAQYLVAYDLNVALATLPLVLIWSFAWLVLRANSGYQSKTPIGVSDLKLSLGPLRWIELAGMMSYSIYLLHKPLGYIAISTFGLGRLVNGPSSLMIALVITLVLIAPIIIVSFVFVELRIRRTHS